ncbi:MAG: hypothetical protein P9L92_03730 [Candidatus Electryonea clarkiae]|nr:hypothetical protein [Candidatus Electryonea clarkiae]MDP8288748.1 hypothetical protein [Candidatus Electryonea clarkiae]
MKIFTHILLLILVIVFSSGCVIRTLNPWLSEETSVSESKLQGVWFQDAEDGFAEAYISHTADGQYKVLLIENGTARNLFVATLHKIDDLYLLVAGPEKKENLEEWVRLPGYLLFKADIQENQLKIFGINDELSTDIFKDSGLTLMEERGEFDGEIILSSTVQLEEFVRAQLPDPAFFDDEPFYDFRRISPR